jgi:hypothetical protein
VTNPLSGLSSQVENYNMEGAPYISIFIEGICGVKIHPLPIDYQHFMTDPNATYGMHDLKQYRLGLNGSVCSSL